MIGLPAEIGEDGVNHRGVLDEFLLVRRRHGNHETVNVAHCFAPLARSDNHYPINSQIVAQRVWILKGFASGKGQYSTS